MSDDTVYVYVGVFEGKRVAVMVDRPEYRKETAKQLAKWIRDGFIAQRETLDTFREKGFDR